LAAARDIASKRKLEMQRLVDDNDVVDACLNHFDDDEYLLDDFEEKKESAFVEWSQRVLEIVFAPVGLQPTVERESPALAPVD
jgi:hypothetical protein